MDKHAFFDFDGTLLNGYSTDSFYRYLATNSLILNGKEVLKRHEIAFNDFYINKSVGYDETTNIMMHIFAFALKGLDDIKLKSLLNKFIADEKIQLYPFAVPLLDFLHKKNYTIHIVTAAIQPVVQTYLKEIGFKLYIYSTQFGKNSDGKYDGSVVRIANGQNKVGYIKGIGNSSYTIGFGDSEGDFPMLETVDTAFLLNPRDKSLEQKIGGNIITVTGNTTQKVISAIEKSIK